MGFGNLRYGWHQEQFELSDVDIYSAVELQNRDEKYGWIARSPRLSDVFAETESEQREAAERFGKIEELRYTRPRRTLRAKARNVEFDHVYLGVPPDRQSRAGQSENRVDHLDLSIRAIEGEDATRLIKMGSVGYFKAREEREESVYAELYVTDDVFDSIERIAHQPNEGLVVSLNVRGWYWLGPIGDSEHYIDTEERERAELAAITGRRVIVGARPEPETGVDEDHPADPLQDLRQMIAKLAPKIESLHFAIWVTAAAAVIIATSVIL